MFQPNKKRKFNNIDKVAEYDEILEEYSDCKYIVCLDNDELDEIITDAKIIYLRINRHCLVCNYPTPNYRYFKIQTDKFITIRYILQEINKQCLGDVFNCNHKFIEGWDIVDYEASFKDGVEMYELMTGS